MSGEPEQVPAGHIPGLPSPSDQQAANAITVPTQTEAVQLILSNQARELDLREKELVLEHAKLDRAYNYAEQALKEQSSFYNREGGLRHSRFRWAITAIVFLALLVAGFLVTLAMTGHEAMAKELFKDVFLLLSGGAGGYGVSKARASQPQQQAPSASATEE